MTSSTGNRDLVRWHFELPDDAETDYYRLAVRKKKGITLEDRKAFSLEDKAFLPEEWCREPSLPKHTPVPIEEWIAERVRSGAMMLRNSVTVDPQIRGGVPVLKGTRIPIAQILAEIADDASVSEIADDLDVEPAIILRLLEGMAIHLDRSFLK